MPKWVQLLLNIFLMIILCLFIIGAIYASVVLVERDLNGLSIPPFLCLIFALSIGFLIYFAINWFWAMVRQKEKEPDNESERVEARKPEKEKNTIIKKSQIKTIIIKVFIVVNSILTLIYLIVKQLAF